MTVWKEIGEKILGEFKRLLTRPELVPAVLRNQLGQRWLIIVLLSLCLTMILLPGLLTKSPEYRVGMIADKYIKADRDFLVMERAATELKRLEAAKASLDIFDYDDRVESQIRSNLLKTFQAVQEVWRRERKERAEGKPFGEGRRERPASIFQQYLGIRLSEAELSVLEEHQYSSEIAERIAGLVAAVYHDRFLTNVAFSPLEYERGLIIKDVKTQAERELKNLDDILQIQDGLRVLRLKADSAFGVNEGALKKAVVSIAGRLLQPNLTFNRQETETRREAAVKTVKPVYFEVQKNEMIVREGEKITAADLDKINALFREQQQQSTARVSGFAGMFALIFSLATGLVLLSQRALGPPAEIYGQNRRLLCLSLLAVIQILLIKAMILISGAVHQVLPVLSTEAVLFLIPFAVGTLMASYLFNQRIALLFSLFISFLIPLLTPGKDAYLALFAFLGFVIVITVQDHYRRRSAFIKTGLVLGSGNVIVILAISLIAAEPHSLDTIWKLAAGFTGGLLSGIIVAGISPIFETVFDFTTDIRLLELANLNHPIFQRMILETPGSYHHSIIVGSMAEAAAEAIGADPILSKVSAYYHDIGKMKKPLYFIENQGKGENRHDKLSPRMSSLIIISHVKNGCELAIQYKLGRKITDIIRQHHGTGLVGYFYEKAKRDKSPSIRALPESHFRYPGPRPQTREAGLVLLADVIEASSRTLVEPTPARIRNLVRDRIENVFLDGQLDECQLTLKDLNMIAESFVRILNGVFHHRVSYYDMASGQNVRQGIKSIYEYPDRKSPEKIPSKSQADS